MTLMPKEEEMLRLALERQRLDETLKRWDSQQVILWLGAIIGVVAFAAMLGLLMPEVYASLPIVLVMIGIWCGFELARRQKEQTWMYRRLRELESSTREK